MESARRSTARLTEFDEKFNQKLDFEKYNSYTL